MKRKWLCLAAGCLALFAACAEEYPSGNTSTNTNARLANRNTNASAPTPNTTTTTSSSNSASSSVNKSTNQTNAAQPTPTTTATPVTEKKKEEGLFSFPPPKTMSITEIAAGELGAVAGQTTLAEISEKLAGGLERTGYGKNDYSYFWNDKDEFAVVTAMERVNADGSALLSNRWVEDDSLPFASSGQYLNYLISGKKVYYRVFAFIITARQERTRRSFQRGTAPDFTTALNWENKGDEDLGGGGDAVTPVESVVWSDKHRCFVLVYLFVNHTSLDAPKSVDALGKSETRLTVDLTKDADAHIKSVREKLGG
jgi:hypothetical protein